MSSLYAFDYIFEEAHQLLLSFCTDIELYVPDAVTMNMHLHMHKDYIYDFSPVASFWLFGFEKFIGYLGKYSTNNRSVEIQMIRKLPRISTIFRFHQPLYDSTGKLHADHDLLSL